MRSPVQTLLSFLFCFSFVSALTYRGADISSLEVVEAAGVHYTDSGTTKAFEGIIAAHGANAARVRVWTSGTYNTAYAISMGKRIKAAGMTLIVDLHYSDTWADPGHQAIPSGWPTTLSGLNTQIYTYTQSIVSQFQAAGVTIDILQIGNEINNGLLWPVGKISVNGINPVSQLLHSAVNGARSVASPKIMIHLANGWDSSGLQSFFNNVFIQGAFAKTDLDIIGVSFYPFYDTSATLSALKSSLTMLANTVGKPIIVAETDWPEACSGVALSESSIAVSATGQATWISDIKNVLSALPNGLGQGILYWEPGWIGNAALGSGCSDNLLVSSNGATRTSIGVFQNM
ncbi:arabinogalactan endo-1,4-beta-galactosidase [Vararia minispora EC-137]|uniref:Arabinogalactan endo-1,4-beta-galactosidase n=1 Tax=Vararia minispora EC-137 TaxID=1314806 RepID=A0ACB8Q9E2_9AGAM|nr:arabinogalactan endo-1,4-beta-galactosidase [Vararia minispora EC-137]